MASILGTIGETAQAVSAGLHKPDRRFIADALIGVLRSRSARVSEWARALREEDADGLPRALKHTHKRLDDRLNSRRWRTEDVERRHWERCARGLTLNDGAGVFIACDYTDIEKRYANLDPQRGQEDVGWCWNGSDGKKSVGYPVAQLEATTADGRRFPLVLRPFSHVRDGYRSQNHEFVRAVEDVSSYVGSRAIYSFDRGFDSRVIFLSLDYAGPGGDPVRWVVRLKAGNRSRHLVTAQGETLSVTDASLSSIPRYRRDIQIGRGRKRRTIKMEIGARTVYTTTESGRQDPTPRTLITVWGFGQEPMVLLASEALRGKAAVMEYVDAYRARWNAELGNRAMKAGQGWGLNLEDSLQVLNFRAVQRVVLLVAIAQTILSEIGAAEHLAKRALRMLGTLGRAPKDNGYQIARGVGELLLRMRREIIAAWREDFDSGG